MFVKKIGLALALAITTSLVSFYVMADKNLLEVNQSGESEKNENEKDPQKDLLPLVKVIKPTTKFMKIVVSPDGKFLICLDSLSTIHILNINCSIESKNFGKELLKIDVCGHSSKNAWRTVSLISVLLATQDRLFFCRAGNIVSGKIFTMDRAHKDLVAIKDSKEIKNTEMIYHDYQVTTGLTSDFLCGIDDSEKTIRIFDINSNSKKFGEEVGRIDLNNWITCLVILQKEKLLCVGTRDGKIQVFNICSNKQNKKLGEIVKQFTASSDPVSMLTASADEKTLFSSHDVTCDVDFDDNFEMDVSAVKMVKVWNIDDILNSEEQNKELLLIENIGDAWYPLTITPNKKILIKSDRVVDCIGQNHRKEIQTISLWNIDPLSCQSGKKIVEITEENPIHSLVEGEFVVTRDNRILVGIDRDGGLCCYQLPTIKPNPLFTSVTFKKIMEPTKSGSHEKINVKDLRDVKIHFDPIYTSKTNNKSKLVEKKETGKNLPLQTVSDLDDLLKNLLVFTQTQKEMLKKEINALLKDNQEQTSSSFIELIKSVEYLFSSATTLVEVYSINKIGIINFVKEKCLETLKLSLQKIASVLSTHGVRSSFFSQKSQAIQEALKKNMKELLETYKNFTAKTGKNVLGLDELVTSVETNFNKYVEKAEKKDDLIIKKN